MKQRNTAILIFDDVEVLDFAGPYEVFSRTRVVAGVESRRSEEHAPFAVFTVAPTAAPVRAVGGLQVIPDHAIDDAPDIDLLVVPGGFGTRTLLGDDRVLDWIAARAAAAETVTSVCTGSLLLAKVGLLCDREATTHWSALDLLGEADPSIKVCNTRFVDDTVITSAGVAAGIDMAFYVVEKLFGKAVADETAQYIDYPRYVAPTLS